MSVCGRCSGGVFCKVVAGLGAQQYAYFIDSPPVDQWSTLQFGKLGGSGSADRLDIGMRQHNGFSIGFNQTNTTPIFTPRSPLATEFTDANGWAAADRYPKIRLTDHNGDDFDDVCGRSSQGVGCQLNSKADTFLPFAIVAPSFNDAAGWSQESLARTIRFADVNGDGRSDVCGLRAEGYYCELSPN